MKQVILLIISALIFCSPIGADTLKVTFKGKVAVPGLKVVQEEEAVLISAGGAAAPKIETKKSEPKVDYSKKVIEYSITLVVSVDIQEASVKLQCDQPKTSNNAQVPKINLGQANQKNDTDAGHNDEGNNKENSIVIDNTDQLSNLNIGITTSQSNGFGSEEDQDEGSQSIQVSCSMSFI